MTKQRGTLRVQAPVALVVWFVVISVHTCKSSVMMREEECQMGGSSRRCAIASAIDRQLSVQESNLRMSVLGVDLPENSENGTVRSFTPLPFAAFMQPRPVYQSSVEKVFNVLERSQFSERLLKGGKRQEDRIKDETTLSESEHSSNSNVSFRRRKGGKRSERKKQLRRERIEKKRKRRKERRKNKQEKKKNSKHPKHRTKDKSKKLRRGKLKSLNPGRRRNREEQVGVNPTIFIEDPTPAALELPITNNLSSPMPLQASHPQEEMILEDPTGVDSEASNQQHFKTREYIDVHNYHESNVDIDDYENDEEDNLMTDMEYFASDTDDYQISPDYFNWKDNASFDYFSQGEDTTVTPGIYHHNNLETLKKTSFNFI